MKLRGFNSATWVSLVPNGLGHVKPNHYWEIVRTIWENRDNLGTAWRILRDGVCDGCALGTTGLRDFTMDGIHLCTVRLNLLRLNTMPPLDLRHLDDVSRLRSLNSRQLRALGRLPYPMLRRRGDAGFRRISWNEALDLIAARIRATDPRRIAFYLTSRGITNETYYVAQKAARFLGTNNVDNAARLCHAPSTTAMKQTLGVAASTCSYRDWIGTDALVFIGSDTPNNQPVTTKYLYYAKQKGTRIFVINPYREPGLERYWVPSVFESALFGTRLADRFFQIHTGGDIAFLNGTLKHLIENDWIDRAFVAAHTNGFPETKAHLETQSWDMLEHASGASREEMRTFAEILAQAKSAVFVWSMGITQHEYGVENVKAILNLALARGFIGREFCGVMPIRGHSGVQGGGEMGCTATTFPGGRPITVEHARWLSEQWGFDVPAWKGLTCGDMLDAAYAGEIDVFYAAGGNFLDTLPDPEYIRTALERPALRVHQDIILSSQMLVDPADTVLLLPAATRYEQRDGGTETSTEREVIFSPEIVPPPAEARQRMGNLHARGGTGGAGSRTSYPLCERAADPGRNCVHRAGIRRHPAAAPRRRPCAVGRAHPVSQRHLRHTRRSRGNDAAHAARPDVARWEHSCSEPVAGNSSTRSSTANAIRSTVRGVMISSSTQTTRLRSACAKAIRCSSGRRQGKCGRG
jgi:molybdopterin-dependent oxidoreductase alpha subunit